MKQKLLGNLNKGIFFVLSAPAGTGKTTLTRMLTKKYPNIVESISHTTRPPRKKEKEGVDYFYISDDEFQKMIKANEFLEYAKVFDYYYGTSKKFVEQNLKNHKHVILVIDTQGAEKLKNKIDAIFIFLSPPSMEELKKRMVNRNDLSLEEIEKRLLWAQEEMKKIRNYDYNITNIDLQITYDVLKSIIVAEEHKVKYLSQRGNN